MTSFDLPFSPIRGTLYSPTELFAGFRIEDAASFAHTKDFEIYRHFIKTGGALSSDAFGTMMQSLHDNSITQSLRAFLSNKRCVAIMGGHKMARNTQSYRDVSDLARQLTNAGMTVASGGGPGAMEATHFGARYSTASDDLYHAARVRLETVPDLPQNLSAIVDDHGAINMDLVAKAHAWFAPAFEVASNAEATGPSLAVPTYHYGHEPSTPLASHISKYFQNSIREDGLLAIADSGVVYTEGKAGTTQEVFQDAAQNYYRSFGRFSPMVFLGVEYWTKKIPVRAVLEALFQAKDFDEHVLFTDKVEAARDFLVVRHQDSAATAGYPSLPKLH